ncbi:HAD family hydrolase [Catellatospora sp. KI3]|uniref:HAD family hydrolase n=1 Tax=Catellatospora sp. KI3 TaxID=3041620 RepID=UPI0024831906|nr:HAD family hydrolase [Catellatospora sp. KI3]MDI1466200.1 HAD family hydrolase [Catellatospora sp. KI3]
MIKAVVFDVGETLIDESRIWSRWADRLGVPRFALLGLIGAMAATDRPFSEAFAMVRPGLDLDAEMAAWAVEESGSLRENFDELDLYPDVKPAFARLRERGLAVIVAGNQPPQAKAALERMDLGADAIYTSAEWGLEKPHPDFFTRVAEVARTAPEHIAYVGDRVDNDVRPAARAGMKPVLIRRGPWGYLGSEHPDAARLAAVIDRLTELPDLLAPAG